MESRKRRPLLYRGASALQLAALILNFVASLFIFNLPLSSLVVALSLMLSSSQPRLALYTFFALLLLRVHEHQFESTPIFLSSKRVSRVQNGRFSVSPKKGSQFLGCCKFECFQICFKVPRTIYFHFYFTSRARNSFLFSYGKWSIYTTSSFI